MSITGPIVNYFYSPVVRPAVERPLSLLANFVREQFRINGGGVLFDTAFDITRSSSKYVYGTGAQTGQLVEVPPNTPAYQHDPVTGAPLGLLVEPSATNLWLHSQSFDDAAHTKLRCSVSANTTLAPDGQTTADTLIEDTSASTSHVIYQSVTGSANTVYSLSVFAKAKERTAISLGCLSSADIVGGVPDAVYFDLVNGTVENQSASAIDAEIQKLPNGWYRCSLVFEAATSTFRPCVWLANAAAPNGRLYTGDGVSGVYIWQGQPEQGSKPTSPIPTTTSTVTRAADIVTSDAATFGDWFTNQQSGTIVFEYTPRSSDKPTGSGFYCYIGSSSSNYIGLGYQPSTSGAITKQVYYNAGGTLSFVNGGNGAVGEKIKIAMTWDVGQFMKVSFSGGSVLTASQPPLSQLSLASTRLQLGSTNGQVNANMYFDAKLVSFEPTAVSDAELQQRSAL